MNRKKLAVVITSVLLLCASVVLLKQQEIMKLVTSVLNKAELIASIDLNNGLVGYWSMNETEGSIAHGFNGQHLSTVGGVDAHWSEGKLGGALDGSVRMYLDEDSPINFTDSFTVSTWVKHTNNILGGKWFKYADKNLMIGRTRTGGKSTGSAVFVHTKTRDYFSFEIGEWMHVAFVYDAATNLGQTFINGDLIGTSKFDPITDRSGNLIVGGAAVHIDEFRVYNRVLSPSQIHSVYSLQPAGNEQVLSVSKSGSGSGVVQIGNNRKCGAQCDVSLQGSTITLTATADESSKFAGWIGGGCSGNGACVVSPGQSKTVSAEFIDNGCGCGSTDSANSCTGKKIEHQVFDSKFKWEFSCGGHACKCGQFVTGDYWVAPIKADGTVVPNVLFTKISPGGEKHGAVVNANLNDKQGWLMPYDNYSAELNIMTKLPYAAMANESILKAETKTSGCGTKSINRGCAKLYDVVSVLSEVPPDAGSTVLRPSFMGDDKTLYSINQLQLERLPTLPGIGLPRVDAIQRWKTPYPVTARVDADNKSRGEFHRAIQPHNVTEDNSADYGADIAAAYYGDQLKIFGSAPLERKKPYVYSMVQKGIDTYGAMQLGAMYGSGAGQSLGGKGPLVLFGALYDDPAVQINIMNIENPRFNLGRGYQEDRQFRIGKNSNGMPLWGDGGGPDATGNERNYWSRLYSAHKAVYHGVSSGGDGQGAQKDPYGYIDGPAGSAKLVTDRARDYQWCCSAGVIASHALSTLVMPWYGYINNVPEVVKYADRVTTGYGVENFAGGYWAAPDKCAPPDPNESLSCNPYTGSGLAKCLYYGGNTKLAPGVATWGPDPQSPGDCIEHDGDPMTDGRWSEFHGFKPTLLKKPNEIWYDQRECMDYGHATYPCEGLGSIPPGYIPYSSLSNITVSPLPQPKPLPEPEIINNKTKSRSVKPTTGIARNKIHRLSLTKQNSHLKVFNARQEKELKEETKYNYPLGLYEFEIEVDAGETETIVIELDRVYDTSQWQYRKFKDNTYIDITEAVTFETKNGKTTISYDVTDNGPLDIDTRLGFIKDPAGPAVEVDDIDDEIVDEEEGSEEGSSGGSSGGSSSGSSGGSSGSSSRSNRSSTVSLQTIDKNISFNQPQYNDPIQVRYLEQFLNDFENENLTVDGVYDGQDNEAVKRFQQKYKREILDVWNLSDATGYVGITTRLKINFLLKGQTAECPVFTEYNGGLSGIKTSSEIGQTQEILRDLDMYNGSINNVWDKATNQALITFQETFREVMLDPWNITKGTGYKYKTTNKFLNYFAGCDTGSVYLEGVGEYEGI